MVPINRRERKKAFMSFLFFFLITVVVMLTTIFFSFQVPLKDNYKMRKELDVAENEKAGLQTIEMKMKEIISLLDSVNLPGVKPYLIDQRISTQINAMNALVDSVSGPTEMYRGIVVTFKSLQAAKEDLRKVNDSKAEIDKLNAELEKRDRTIEQLNDRYETFRNSVIQSKQSK